MQEEIKDLTLLFTDAALILQECRELKARLALELQATRDDRRAQHMEFQAFMSKLEQTLARIQAQFKVEAQLLNLVRPTGEDKWQKEESRSSQSHMLKAYAKNSR